MNIPQQLRAALASADDAYLIGLSNKGTVNRAKKDLEKSAPAGEAGTDFVTVTLGTEQCVIRSPWARAPAPVPAAPCAAIG